MKITDLVGHLRRNRRGPRIARMIQKEFSLRENMLIEGARIEHPEDMMFTDGSKGARAAIDAMIHAVEDHGAITVKWDGKPALIFGRDDQGRFIMTDKSGFTAKGYNGLATSPKQLASILAGRGEGRENLIQMLVGLWPLFQRAVPENFRGFVQGDLLYSDTPPDVNGEYVFTPNTVTYKISTKSPMGHKIAASKAAIAVHTFYPGIGADAVPLESLRGLRSVGPLLIMPSTLEQTKPIVIKQRDLEKAIGVLDQYHAEIDELLNPVTLRTNKITDFPNHLKRFINLRVRERNLKNLAKGFESYLQTANLTPSKAANLKAHVDNNKIGLQASMQLFGSMSDIKHSMINQLDASAKHIQSEINGVPGGEGYVVDTPHGKIKLVKRTNFSASNFERNQ